MHNGFHVPLVDMDMRGSYEDDTKVVVVIRTDGITDPAVENHGLSRLV